MHNRSIILKIMAFVYLLRIQAELVDGFSETFDTSPTFADTVRQPFNAGGVLRTVGLCDRQVGRSVFLGSRNEVVNESEKIKG